jgi:hypothetical protein
MARQMTTLWIATLGASLVCYLLKLAGFLIPSSILSRPRLVRINELIPVVLLSALISIQTLTAESKILVDHRMGGLVVAFVALKFRAQFPVMMLAAAITSAIIYRLSI